MKETIQGNIIIPGEAQGELLVGREPLSFWGGYDQHTGEIIDRRHPLSGQVASGRILALPFARGSSTGAAVLLESIRAGTAPVAMLTVKPDHFFALASIVADEMYEKAIPLVALTETDFAHLNNGRWIKIHLDGTVDINHSP
ncbi:MAG: DUF126 domain-containing protein [Chloroflexota bacterium]